MENQDMSILSTKFLTFKAPPRAPVQTSEPAR